MKHFSKLFLALFLLTGWGTAYAQVSPSFTQDEYKQALWMTTRFYGAQRSGNGPNWLLTYHEQKGNINPTAAYKDGKSFIKDADGSYDLTGGWFDCGDHVKFGQTEYYSAYMLILGYSEFPKGYDDHYSFDYSGYRAANDYTWKGKKGKPNGIPDILDELKYATDYFQKCVRDKNTFYYQVGNGDYDHKQWVTSSKMSTLAINDGGESNGSRPVYKATGNVTSMASLCGATLAAMARLYKPFDPAYAQKCLEKAIVCYEFVSGTTKGNTGGGGYYPAKGKYEPDMVIFYAELYRTTNDSKYLKAAEDAAGFVTNANGWNHNYSLNYNNTEDLAFYLLAVTKSSLATTAKDRLKYYVETLYKPTSGYFLNKMNGNWGILRFPANQAFVYGLYDKLEGKENVMNPYALTSIEYIMGKNSRNFSFITGFGANSPKLPHHRNYFGSDANNMNGLKAQDIEFGYMVGGRLDPAQFTESLSNYELTEGGIDYNAGLVGALGYINSILNPVNTGQFGNPTPDLGDDVSICGMSSITLDSKVPADGRKRFTWKRGTEVVVNASTTASTYQATQAGEYTCEIDSAGVWKTSGTVNVLGVLPEVSLGDDVTLCNPASATLATEAAGGGISYKWYKDNNLIAGATNASLFVTQPGTYKCTISATGCPDKSDEVKVSSNLPIIADATSNAAGQVTLTVSGTGTYEWHAADTGGTPLHVGNTFTTTINKHTTFYVQDAGAASFKTGPSATTFTGNGVNWGNIGAIFTTKKALMITGFTVKPTGIYNTDPVSITVDLMKDGNKVKTYTSKAADNKGASQNYVLIFEPPIEISDAGEYSLVPSGGIAAMFYESGPAYSTYSSSDVITFTGATNGTQSNNPFPAMFDWQIQSGSGCARALAQAIYNPNGSVGIEVQPSGICNLYPNPVKDVLYLNLNCNSWNASQEVRIEILSTLGSPVKNITTTVENASVGINLSELQQGIYLVRIISGNSVSVKQIIKK